jgi:hypothetical protein
LGRSAEVGSQNTTAPTHSLLSLAAQRSTNNNLQTSGAGRNKMNISDFQTRPEKYETNSETRQQGQERRMGINFKYKASFQIVTAIDCHVDRRKTPSPQ